MTAAAERRLLTDHFIALDDAGRWYTLFEYTQAVPAPTVAQRQARLYRDDGGRLVAALGRELFLLPSGAIARRRRLVEG